MPYSLLALNVLNYRSYDSAVVKGLEGVERFAVENYSDYSVQNCVSPVCDTLWSSRELVESGVEADHKYDKFRADPTNTWQLFKKVMATTYDSYS